MTKSHLFGVAILLSALSATPAFAQWSFRNQEPSAYAAIYPNGNPNDSARPAADAQAMTPRLIMRHSLPGTRAKSSK
jgi:hypothetical protein